MIPKVESILENVYGKYTGPAWKPQPYAEYKSRYLWTDAFGVCNFLTLYKESKKEQYLIQAKALIEDVHSTLGMDRKLLKRLGKSTEEHPTLGGLRIGKVDEEGTKDGDGQYFHYLTKWMFALAQTTIISNDGKYLKWAIELAESIHDHFVVNAETPRPRMYWKMSVDLTKPWVKSEGNLDPFDGYVTYRILQTIAKNPDVLKRQISELEKIVTSKYKAYSSTDSLDLGETLWVSHWFPEEDWSKTLKNTCIKTLDHLYDQGEFTEGSSLYRLAFREFGTTIGMQLFQKEAPHWKERIEKLNAFWANHIFERDSDITPVMFCTSLNPGVFSSNYLK